jgi:hypothetical protein
MDPNLLARYKAERAEGFNAYTALKSARSDLREPTLTYPFLRDLDIDRPTTGTVGPFTVTVQITPDQDAKLGEDDISGWFTDTYETGCIKNTCRDWTTDYEWYRPCNDTLNNLLRYLRQSGMSKGAAQDFYAEQVRREMAIDASRQYFCVDVSVKVAGRGLANASLSWIDVIEGYDPMPYFREVAEDLIPEALGEARDAIPAALARLESTVAALRAAGVPDTTAPAGEPVDAG